MKKKSYQFFIFLDELHENNAYSTVLGTACLVYYFFCVIQAIWIIET